MPRLLALLALSLPLVAADRAAVVAHYADLVHASYVDALTGAKVLRERLATLVKQPSDETLQAARAAWLAAREPYGQTEAFRFYAGPIDDEDGPEGQLNAWPLDENYIDATVDQPDAGIINDAKTYPEITAALLSELNEKDGDANISTGYHAIEFLLWGQDLSADGAGQRPASDYATAANAPRRAAYLLVVADLLIADLEGLVAEWAPAGAYRTTWTADVDASLGRIIIGIGSLAGGELAGERMAVALENKDQEDEHSCFSDNTHRDIVGNFLGITNVWTGSYRRTDGTDLRGPSIRDLVLTADPDLAKRIDASAAAVTEAIAGIKAPFDQEIITDAGRARVQAAIEALWAFTRLLPQAAAAIGVQAAIEGL